MSLKLSLDLPLPLASLATLLLRTIALAALAEAANDQAHTLNKLVFEYLSSMNKRIDNILSFTKSKM